MDVESARTVRAQLRPQDAKAAYLAFPDAAIWQVAEAQRDLAQAGWTFRVLTMDGQPIATDGGVRLVADGSIRTTFPRDFGMVLLAGGKIADSVLEDTSLIRFLRQFDAGQGWIASIGQSTGVLAAAGILGGIRCSVDAPLVDDKPHLFETSILVDNPVVVDGNVVTARADAASAFRDALMERI